MFAIKYIKVANWKKKLSKNSGLLLRNGKKLLDNPKIA